MGQPKQLKPCYYCGRIATGIDHIPPLAVRQMLGDFILEIKTKIKDVPCCLQCNCMLGADAPFNLTERKRLLKERLRRKHAKLLKAPIWTEGEIEELGYNLRTMVCARQALIKEVKERLKW